jgi:hypothetical protein
MDNYKVMLSKHVHCAIFDELLEFEDGNIYMRVVDVIDYTALWCEWLVIMRYAGDKTHDKRHDKSLSSIDDYLPMHDFQVQLS